VRRSVLQHIKPGHELHACIRRAIHKFPPQFIARNSRYPRQRFTTTIMQVFRRGRGLLQAAAAELNTMCTNAMGAEVHSSAAHNAGDGESAKPLQRFYKTANVAPFPQVIHLLPALALHRATTQPPSRFC